MKDFYLYGLMLIACALTGIVASLMRCYSWWYGLLLVIPLPLLWLSGSLFHVLINESQKFKASLILIGCLIVLLATMIYGTLFIGTNSFWGFALALFLLTGMISTIVLIISTINKKRTNQS